MTDKIEPTATALISAGITEGVFKRGAEAFTTSKAIAKHFGKRPADVLRAIDRILEDAPEHERDFALELTPVSTGNGGTRHVRVYRMNWRAVALLVMGFTGAKALRWKNAFLDAFDTLLNEHHRRDQWEVTRDMKAVFAKAPANPGWAKIQAKRRAEAAKLRRLRQSDRPN